jgi:hypothetical protein
MAVVRFAAREQPHSDSVAPHSDPLPPNTDGGRPLRDTRAPHPDSLASHADPAPSSPWPISTRYAKRRAPAPTATTRSNLGPVCRRNDFARCSACLDVVAEALELVVKNRLGFLRLRRGDEGPRVELLVVAERLLEPGRELPRHPELVQGLTMIPFAFVNGGVPGAAEIVEERALRCPDNVPLPEPVDELVLPFLATREEPHLRGSALREDLTELAQLEERDGRVGGEVLLCLRRERDEPRVVVREVGEVGGGLGAHRESEQRGSRTRELTRGSHPTASETPLSWTVRSPSTD